MKINEVVNEGIWDTVKQVGAGIAGAAGALKSGSSPVAGAKIGAAASAASTKQKDLINRVTTKAVADWAKFAQNKKVSGTPATVADAEQWFTTYTGGVSKPKTPPAGTSPVQMQQWLSKEVAGYMANKAAGTSAPQQPTQQTQQPTGQQPAAQPKPIEAGNKTRAGTEVIKPEPLTLKYKNQNYVRGGERGEWTRFGSTKPLPATEQAFLDSEEDELTGTQTTQQPATAQQPASPQTQQSAAPSKIQATVATDAGYVYKKEDGNWYRENGTKVNAYDEVEDLEQQWMDARATARAKGKERDAAQAQQPTPAGAQDLPDVSSLTPEERTQLIQQIKQQLGQQA